MRKTSVTLRALKLYHGYNKRYFPLRLLQTLFSQTSPYFNLWMSAEIVNALYDGKTGRELFVLVAVTLFGNLLLHILGAWLGRTVGTELKRLNDNEGAAFNHKTISLDYDKLENPEVRTLRRKITENSYINDYGVTAMRYAVEGIFRCTISLAFAAALFAEMVVSIAKAGFTPTTVLLLIGLVGFVVVSILYRNYVEKKTSDRDKRIGDLMLKENRLGSGYSLHGMDSRIYKQQPILSELYDKMNKEHFEVFSQARMQSWALHSPFVVLSKLSEICAYLIVCFYCLAGVFPVGGVIKYVGYLNRVTGNVFDMFYYFGRLKNNEPFLKPYLQYFDLPNEMYQGSLAVEKRSDKKFDISFCDVSFRYPGAAEYALKHINLDLKVGERLAVVGMNGSGKTTFIKLLCRLYDPTEGEIRMNDFNIRKYDYREYLDLFSVVFQDYTLLSLPLGNNISCAENWDTAKAEKLIAEVALDERYAEMPMRLHTPLYKHFDEDGVNVSGGEAQKIALARALYRDAPFIILDEPTAALDPIAEAEIYSKFDSIVGDKTAIYISHRLSSCRFCDKIAVFDQGQIVQVGSHDELLSDKNGKYHELWNAQAKYYA